MKNRHLLCTFSDTFSYKSVLKSINTLYSPAPVKFFIFENIKNKKELYITYNVDATINFNKTPSTLSIHRKKETDTLYTLNAMNRLIADENSGVMDKNFKLNWELYKNCLLLTGDISVKIVSIYLLDII
jgi:hypothetical protein